jgi:hypothetical protein
MFVTFLMQRGLTRFVFHIKGRNLTKKNVDSGEKKQTKTTRQLELVPVTPQNVGKKGG